MTMIASPPSLPPPPPPPSASPQNAIRIYNLDSEEMLNHIRYHDGFMGQRIGPTKCLAFHPYKVRTFFIQENNNILS